MDGDRLLTRPELVQFCPEAALPIANRVALNQDAKTAAIVKAATLRAVGEAFEARSFVVTSNIPDLDGKTAVYLEQSDLTDLRNGQWPAGWEKE